MGSSLQGMLGEACALPPCQGEVSRHPLFHILSPKKRSAVEQTHTYGGCPANIKNALARLSFPLVFSKTCPSPTTRSCLESENRRNVTKTERFRGPGSKGGRASASSVSIQGADRVEMRCSLSPSVCIWPE